MKIDDQLFLKAGLPTPELLANFFQRSIKTTRTWKKTGDVPREVGELLAIQAGKMPWPGFQDFVCKNFQIIAPGRQMGLTANQIAAYEFKLQELAAVRRDLDQLKGAPCQYLIAFPGENGEDEYLWRRY